MIIRYKKEFIAQQTANTDSAALHHAVSGLIAVLHQKQTEEKSRVVGAFTVFSQRKVADEFHQLFTHSSQAALA